MEEKKKLNVSLGTVVCIVIIFLLIIAMMGMYIYYNKNNGNKNNENNNATTNENVASNKIENAEENNESTENETKKVKKVDESKDLVYSVYNKITSEGSYNIPAINIDSESVKSINDEVYIYCKTRAEEDGAATNIKYKSYIHDNILSLVVSAEYPNDCIYYHAYNVNIYTGKIIINENLLKSRNVTESEFVAKLKELAKEKYVAKYNKLSDDVAYTGQLNKTISDDNCSYTNSMFLNENGKISVIVNIYSLAGADKYEEIVETDF